MFKQGNAIVKFVKEAYGTQTLLIALKAGGWKVFFDGTLAQATVVHGPNATLIGTDSFGNKYYQRMTEQFGRHRWVVYGDLDWPSGQDPTSVSPEWHGWLNGITDRHPGEGDFQKPIFHVPHFANKTGTLAVYSPKGNWRNPQKRNWKKRETWDYSKA
ncbi:hypothetical protein WJX81_000392 [Elliptochloris bilobata]|uniref:NADH dehydrogenase [ubiquinone] 1 alpha subcomplex subunit 12 n=1 Tax=Elliptochloris bilobata TaxID=381761 RepID=A0AAW1S7C8_9CHLO